MFCKFVVSFSIIQFCVFLQSTRTPQELEHEIMNMALFSIDLTHHNFYTFRKTTFHEPSRAWTDESLLRCRIDDYAPNSCIWIGAASSTPDAMVDKDRQDPHKTRQTTRTQHHQRPLFTTRKASAVSFSSPLAAPTRNRLDYRELGRDQSGDVRSW